MKKIRGNKTAVIQIKDSDGKNAIGENVEVWTNAVTLKGYLDYSAGQNDVNQYNAKIQDTTHIFLADYDPLETVDEDLATSENCRFVVDGNIYNVLQIDDPMGLHQHLEIYLKYIGGGLGV